MYSTNGIYCVKIDVFDSTSGMELLLFIFIFYQTLDLKMKLSYVLFIMGRLLGLPNNRKYTFKFINFHSKTVIHAYTHIQIYICIHNNTGTHIPTLELVYNGLCIKNK